MIFTLCTFILTEMCPSPSPLLSYSYFGALRDNWHTQINIGEGETHPSVSRVLTSIVGAYMCKGKGALEG